MVIDAHVHLYPTAERGAQAKGRADPPHGTLEELHAALHTLLDGAIIANFLPLKLMREQAGTSDADLWRRQRRQNEWVLELARADDRLRVLVGAFPIGDDVALEELDSWLAEPRCAGIKLHPSAGDYRADDARVMELAAVAARRDKAVMIHAGPFAPGHRDVTSDELCALAAATTGRLVVAHLGGAGADAAVTIATTRPQVWLDTSAILTSLTGDEARALMELVVGAIGDRQLIHGSDTPFFDFAESLERLQAALPPGASPERLLAGNAAAAYLFPPDLPRGPDHD